MAPSRHTLGVLQKMTDGKNPNLYNDFARVAQDLTVYTGVDCARHTADSRLDPCALCSPPNPSSPADASIMEHLNELWKIEHVTGLSPEAQEAQEFLARLPARFRKLAERQEKAFARTPREPREWSWLHGRVL